MIRKLNSTEHNGIKLVLIFKKQENNRMMNEFERTEREDRIMKNILNDSQLRITNSGDEIIPIKVQ